MPFLIGSDCCDDQIVGGGSSSGDSSLSGKNEPILFDAVNADYTDIEILWNNTRKARFGDCPVFMVEMWSAPDNKYLVTTVMAWPDSIINTTKYTVRIPGPGSGRIVIS